MRAVEDCGVCERGNLDLVLDLGTCPPTCHMHPVGRRQAETHYPLQLLRCADCGLVQLSVAVDPSEVFPPDYPYSSGNSKALHANFEKLARRVPHEPDDLVVDIGANDGTLLSKFDCRTVGVEPTGQAQKIDGPAYEAFFTEALAREIRNEHGPAKIVTACNVLAHVDGLSDVMRGIATLLADDGVLVAENHDLQSVVDGQWDTVYHEHLRFFDPASIAAMLGRHGFGVRSWEPAPTHGGSFRVFAGRGRETQLPAREYDFDALRRKAIEDRTAIRRLPPLVGIGATARATTIINYCGLDVLDVGCVYEVSGSDKIGRYIPGTRIPIIDEAEIGQQRDSVLFSWHLADVIVPKLRERGYQGRVHLPLGTP